MKRIIVCIQNKDFLEQIESFCQEEKIAIHTITTPEELDGEPFIVIITDQKDLAEAFSTAGKTCVITNDKVLNNVYCLKESFNHTHLRLLVDIVFHGALLTNYYPSLMPYVFHKEYTISNDFFNIYSILYDMTKESLEDLQKTLELIKKRNLRLIGVFTHNGYGDMDNRNLSDEFLLQQNIFRNVKQIVLDFVNNNNMPLPRFHSLSSSGAIKCREIDDDLVRIGIAMYGYLGVDCDLNLNPIAELWVDKISSRYLKAGSKIGYDGKYVLNNDCIVSSYDIGYGDGLFRLNENHSEMRTKDGSLILPRMSMDVTSIISDKDRLCFMHDANEVARIFGTIPYEVLCRISPFIKREIVD